MVSLSRVEKVILLFFLSVATLLNWLYLLSTNA
jgi:cell division protein FtsL